jgi:hypothetical protein
MMAGSSLGSSCKTSGEGRGCSTSVDGATEGEAVAELEGEDSKKSSCDNGGDSEEKGNDDSSKTTCREIITRRVDKSRQR